jgi:hypothetical protein
MTTENEPRPASDPDPNPASEPSPAPADDAAREPAPAPEPVADVTPPQTPTLRWGQKSTGTNGFAVAALVVGIIGLCFCFGFLGVIFGSIAKRQIEETGEAGAGMATAGIVLGWISAALGAVRFLGMSGAGPTVM